MTYRGYSIKRTTQALPQLGERGQMGIFDGDKLLAYVANDRDFAKHVVDVKIKEGAWPPLEGTATTTQGGTKA